MAGRTAAAAAAAAGGAKASEAPGRRSATSATSSSTTPNRGALITSGNGGSVEAGRVVLQRRDVARAREQCGATDGRIAWAGPGRVLDGLRRAPGPGRGLEPERPPLAGQHALPLRARPAAGASKSSARTRSVPFLGTSYQAMHAAGCLSPNRLLVRRRPAARTAGRRLQLHWNGAGLDRSPILPEGHPSWDMVSYEGPPVTRACGFAAGDKVDQRSAAAARRCARSRPKSAAKKARSNPSRPKTTCSTPRTSSRPRSIYLRLEHRAKARCGPPRARRSTGSAGTTEPAGVTIVRKRPGGECAERDRPAGERRRRTRRRRGRSPSPNTSSTSIAAEPGTSERVGRARQRRRRAVDHALAQALARPRQRRTAAVSDRLELPARADPHGPLGAANAWSARPTHDCWATTADGWLLHLATPAERADPNVLSDPAFAASRRRTDHVPPADAGVPQETPDVRPGRQLRRRTFTPQRRTRSSPAEDQLAQVPVPLLSHVRARVIHRTTTRAVLPPRGQGAACA